MELTNREREIIFLLAQGYGYKGIARCLGISSQTVKQHLVNAYGKIGARNAAHAVFILMSEEISVLKKEKARADETRAFWFDMLRSSVE